MAEKVVRNINEVNRAFAKAGEQFRRDRDRELRRLAAPVAADAERLAKSRISRITTPWSKMRVGVLTDSVYLAPNLRGTRVRSRKRPKFGTLLMERAMKPALDQNVSRVERSFDELLAKLERSFNG